MSTPTATQFPRLPRLVSGNSVWYLPLNDCAASELARLLVMDELAEREGLAAQLMSVDPCVTLWVACAVGGQIERDQASDAAPRCVLDLARWLARGPGRLLKWSPDELAAAAAKPEHRSRWRELAADGVGVGALAAEPIEDDDVAAEAFLYGLLHNAADWLGSCGPRVSVFKEQSGCLPRWLANRLRERSRTPRSEPMQHVVKAVKTWRESGRRSRQVAGIEVTDALKARRRWQSVSCVMEPRAHFLVAFSEKLRRLDQLERDYQRTLEQEKLASLGELAYGASHEINNPLANISTRAQTLLVDEAEPERRRTLAIINTQAFRANEMIADMMLFARPPELVREEVDLVQLIDALIQELAEEADLQGTQLARSGRSDPLRISADPTQLAMAVRAVIVNSLQALGADGEIDVNLQQSRRTDHGGRQWACIAVRDNGPGIPTHVRRHLFDPFYSGREAGRGLGLGLAKCWRVVSLHEGRIEVSSSPGQYTTIVLILPVNASSDTDSETMSDGDNQET